MPLTKDQEQALINTIRENNRKLKELLKKMDRITLTDMDNETFLSPEEAAKYIGFSVSHIYKNLKQEIPHVQRNRGIKFRKSDLDKWLEKNTVNPV